MEKVFSKTYNLKSPSTYNLNQSNNTSVNGFTNGNNIINNMIKKQYKHIITHYVSKEVLEESIDRVNEAIKILAKNDLNFCISCFVMCSYSS